MCEGAPWATGTWVLSWLPLKVIWESQGFLPGESAPWYFQPNPMQTKHASSAGQVPSKYLQGKRKGDAEGGVRTQGLGYTSILFLRAAQDRPSRFP